MKEVAVIRRSIVSLTAACLVLALSAGRAAAATAADPDDTSGKLDLSRITAIRRTNGDAKITIKTYETWHKNTVAQNTGNNFRILIDTNGDGVADVVGTISTNGTNGLHIEYTGDAGGPYPVKHPDGFTAVVILEHGTPAAIRREFQTAATSRFVTDAGACSSACVDRAPDSGGLTVPGV
jgi:hypothetical protein